LADETTTGGVDVSGLYATTMLLLDYQNVLIESILKDRLAPEYVSKD